MIVTFNLPDNERVAVKAADVHAVAKKKASARVFILTSDKKSDDSFTLADTFDEAVAKWRAALQPTLAADPNPTE